MDVSPELAELSRTIDMAVLGQRIKTARVAARMTQAQLATPEASTAYLSRIESGHRRPELKLLLRFAEKANVPLEQLLIGVTRDQQTELGTHVDQAAWAITAGEHARARELLASVSQTLEGTPESDQSAEVAYLNALAHRAEGDLDQAIIALEDLVHGGESPRWWLEAAVALTRCYAEAGEVGQTVATGESVLSVLDSLGLINGHHAQVVATAMASAHRLRGDQADAAAVIGRVILAEGEDPGGAATYHRAGMEVLERGDANLARSLARAARELADGSEQRASTARFHITAGELHLAESDPVRAKASLQTATHLLGAESASSADMGRARVGLARVLLAEGDPAAAADLLSASESTTGSDPLLDATRLLLLSQVRRGQRKAKEAKASLTQATAALRSTGPDRAAAQLWFELGEALEAAGEGDASRDAFRRAAAATGLMASTSRVAVEA